MTTQQTLGDFFCFTDGRTNFDIDPLRDAAHMFGNSEWAEEIRRMLQRSVVLDQPLRLVWFGQYGIGKTHRLHHTIHIALTEMREIRPVPVTCTDIGDKTGFESLQYQLVNNLGFDDLRSLTKAYMRRVSDGDAGVRPPEAIGQSGDVAKAVRSLGGDNDKLARESWKYLTGIEIDNADTLETIGATKPVLNTSVEYASVLGILGTIVRAQTNQRLLYLIDQMEAVSKISNKTTLARWVETLRAVLDLKSVGLAAAVGAESASLDDLPRIFLEPEIVRRIGDRNYLTLQHYQTTDMAHFVSQMLRVWIDPKRRDDLAVAEGWANDPEYAPDLYPFTSSSFSRLCRHLAVDAERAKPSVAIDTLNKLAAEAYIDGRRLIDDGILDANDIIA